MELRDYWTSLWSQPVRSSKLERAFQQQRAKPASVPNLHRCSPCFAACVLCWARKVVHASRGQSRRSRRRSTQHTHCLIQRSAKDVAEAAHQQAEVQRLTGLCQKPSDQRTSEEIR